MKRREILKKLGIGALSLAGIERLAKAMGKPEPSSIDVCEDGVAVACVVSASPGGEFNLSSCTNDVCPNVFRCNGGATNFYCDSSFNCVVQHTCDPTPNAGDFRCNNFFTCGVGATGVFRCLGSDPGNDAQFLCIGAFHGCYEASTFDCDDFRCRGTYNCGSGHTGCPTPVPGIGVDCQGITGGYHA